MADGKSMFDVGNFLSVVSESVQAQAATDMKLAETTAAENRIVADSAAVYNREAQFAKQRFDAVQAKAEDARAKANSGNIFDRITLMGDQILDPANYTQEGRQAQITEIQQELAMEGQIHNIQNNLSGARINEATAQRNLETITNNLGVNALRSQIEANQLAVTGMQAVETVRQTALLQFDTNTLNQALMGPVGKTGKIALNGIEYTPTELRERSNNLKTREQLSMLNPMANDPDFAAKMGIAHQMQLATMSVAELEALKNDGFMINGQQVNPGIWDAAYNRANELAMIGINRTLAQEQMKDVVPEFLASNHALIQKTQKWSTPGTAIDNERRKLQMTMEGVALANQDPATDPMLRQARVGEMIKQQDRFVKSIQGEAMRRAAGDEKLGNLYTRQMLGESISLEEVADVGRQRYTKRQSMGELLPPQITDQVRRLADKNVASLQMQNAQAAMQINGVKLSDTEMREQAFNNAFDTIRAQEAGNFVKQIEKELSTRKDNPAIAAGLPPLAMDKIKLDANAAAKSKFMEMTQLKDEQFLYLMAGNFEGAKVSPEQATVYAKQYNMLEAQFTYDQLDKYKSGLGYETQQWYAQESGKMADVYTQNMDPMLGAVFGDSIKREVQSLNDDRLQADQSAADRVRKEFTELSTGARRPENSWMLMLNMTDSLEDAQKQMLYYEVLDPAMKSARAAGMNDEQTNEVAFKALNEFQTDDKVTQSAVKMLQRNLPKIVTSFQDQWDAAMAVNRWSPFSNLGGKFLGGGIEGAAAATQLKKSIKWAR